MRRTITTEEYDANGKLLKRTVTTEEDYLVNPMPLPVGPQPQSPWRQQPILYTIAPHPGNNIQ